VLGAVEGNIGIDQQALVVNLLTALVGDADRNATAAFVPHIGQGLAHAVDDAGGEPGEIAAAAPQRTDDDKLVATDARDEVILAHILA